jgi:hypothetical protein
MPKPTNSRHRPCLAIFAVTLLAFSSCQQRVILAPDDNSLVVLNGCVISACNYLAVVKTQHRLEPDFWAKVLLVRFNNRPAGHAYCVWETEGTIYGYDRNSGGFPIPVYTRDPRAIAIILAQELSKVMHETLSVGSAEFVEPTKVELYQFSESKASESTPPVLLGISTINKRALSVVGANLPAAHR